MNSITKLFCMVSCNNRVALGYCAFCLFQTRNHTKVLWDLNVKPKRILGRHLNILSVMSKTDQLGLL